MGSFIQQEDDFGGREINWEVAEFCILETAEKRKWQSECEGESGVPSLGGDIGSTL